MKNIINKIDYDELIDSCIFNIKYYQKCKDENKQGVLSEFYQSICTRKLNKYFKILVYLTKRQTIYLSNFKKFYYETN